MTRARKSGYVQDVRYSGFAGANTGYVKWRKRESDDMPGTVSGSSAESNFLSLGTDASESPRGRSSIPIDSIPIWREEITRRLRSIELSRVAPRGAKK